MSQPTTRKVKIPCGAIVKHRYLIKRLLGQGGLGRTYFALDTHRFDEPCILKEFSLVSSRQFDLEKSRELFKREARILYQLTHAQIPQFQAHFADQGRLFLAQEYIQGKTYSALLKEQQQKKRTFRESEIIRLLLDLLPVLDYIHQHHIIHQNIAPNNIMLPEGKTVPVLIDFGVGKLTNQMTNQEGELNSQSALSNMSFVGKIGYAPKEQIGRGICSPSSDIYSLAVTVLVLLTGKQPTYLLDRYSLAWKWQQYTQISAELQKILQKAIAEQPEQRYQSAQEILQDIQRKIINRSTTIQTLPNFQSSSTRSASAKKLQAETMIINQVNSAPKSPSSQTSDRSSAQKIATSIINKINSSPPQSSNKNQKSKPAHNAVVSQTGTRLVNFFDSEQQPSSKPETKAASSPRPLDETMIVSNTDSSF